MGCLGRIGKGTAYSQKSDLTSGREPFGFALGQIKHQSDFSFWRKGRIQEPQKAGFDQPGKRGGRAGNKAVIANRDKRLVVTDELCAQGHHMKRQRRFPRARGAEDQKPTALYGHTTGMQANSGLV